MVLDSVGGSRWMLYEGSFPWNQVCRDGLSAFYRARNLHGGGGGVTGVGSGPGLKSPGPDTFGACEHRQSR